MAFLSWNFPFKKFQFHQSALKYVAMATIRFLTLILKTRISFIFQVFPPGRNSLWDNLLCFGLGVKQIHRIIAYCSLTRTIECRYYS